MAEQQALLIYDGECGFCKYCVEFARRATGESVGYQPYQRVQQQFPDISTQTFKESIQLVKNDGRVCSGAQAAFEALAVGGYSRIWAACYQYLPLFAGFSERAYRFVAAHRNGCYRLSKLLFGGSLEPQSLSLTIWIFLRLLALIYCAAFTSFALQALGLIGEHGILPLGNYYDAVSASYGVEKFFLLPSLFWLGQTDWIIQTLSWSGVLLSVLLFFDKLPGICLLVLYILYLSIFNAGQVFMSFQWDILLLECGFLAIFLRSSPLLFTWLFRWLLFRFMLQSGLVKLISGDEHWRQLSALSFHFETQPLPTTLAWYVHKLPAYVLEGGVIFTFLVELLIPFLILMPRKPRQVAALLIFLLELSIFVTGSYNYFNLLTMALCVLLLDDQCLTKLQLSWRHGLASKPHILRAWLHAAVATLYLLSSLLLLSVTGNRGALSDTSRQFLSWSQPLHMVNGYGLFAVMTTQRPEIIIEGSADGVEWLAYELPYKPGDLERAPVWATPHQPRLDWQLWFAALAPADRNPWLSGMILGLLTGSESVLSLFSHNPFPQAPPRYLRASLYQYHFSTERQKTSQGVWWQREYDREFIPVVKLTRE